MRTPRFIDWLGRGLSLTPAAAVLASAALIAVSLMLAVVNERAARGEAVQQTRVQAEILAGSVAAPLAFDDAEATREYVNALGANPAVEAAGAYDARGRLAAAFHRSGAPAPARSALAKPQVDNGRVIVTAPVRQGTTRLGAVYLRVATENLLHRWTRYLGIGVIVIMSSLMVAVLGSSHASLREAHAKLQEQIRERERAEEAFRQAQKMEAMGQLTGGVAHDFNNLLMVASSGLDLLDRTTDAVRRERLKQGIRQAIDRGADLTQQLLAFARKTPLKTEVVDLGAVLAGMRDVLDRSLREDITVRVERQPGLWPVEIDPSQFEVAILNMAINARDAMPNGGEILISLANAPAGEEGGADCVWVRIRDHGVGMPAELTSRIFEPFFTTKGVGKGTGLGLAQVYGFARASGGDISVESEPGQGTTFTLALPRSHKLIAAAPAAVARPGAGGERRRRVLLVEDDDRVAELVGEMLGELGCECFRAASAAAALDAMTGEGPFDLVFSDMVMPGEMNGLDLARQVQARWPRVPVLLTTGYSASAAAAAAEGMRVLVKPYRIDALAAEIDAVFGQGRVKAG